MQRPPERRARSSLLYSPAQDEGHIKWLPLRAELAMNFMPATREGAPLLMEGLIGGYSILGCVQGGTGFPDGWGFGKCVPEFAFGTGCGFPLRPLAESASQNPVAEWDAVSRWGCRRKLHPIPCGNCGMGFPRAGGRNDDVTIRADLVPFEKMRHAVRKNETREIACFV